MKKLIHITIITLAAFVMLVQFATAQTVDRSRVAVSPFAQVVPGGPSAGGFYSFLAFTHPSLSTAASNIGLTVSLEGTTAGQIVGSTSINFTVGAGETHKLFIVATNHPSINPTTNNAAFTARDHFITTTSSGAVLGNVRILSDNTTPTVQNGNGKYENLNQIAMWGVVFAEASNAGFSMEFIGDMHDSTLPSSGVTLGSGGVPTGGRGMN